MIRLPIIFPRLGTFCRNFSKGWKKTMPKEGEALKSGAAGSNVWKTLT